MSTAHITELVPTIGYEMASKLAREMLANGETWAEVQRRVNRTDQGTS